MKAKLSSILVWALAVGVTVCGPGTRRALAVSCGDVLTDDATLDSDLSCSGTALVIGADGVTVDLGGHVLSGDGTGVGVDNAGGYYGVTINNGTIHGFQHNVLAHGAGKLTMKGLTVVGGLFSIYVVDSHDVAIKESSVSQATVGIELESVEGVSMKGIQVSACFLGIEAGSCGPAPTCPPLEEQPPTTGSIQKSTVSDCQVVGLALPNVDDFTVAENVFSGSQQGVRIGVNSLSPSGVRITENEISNNFFGILALSLDLVGGPPHFPISDLVIAENDIHDNVRGVALVNVHDSRISENRLTDNAQFGLYLFETSSGNRVAENTVTGSGEVGIGLIARLGNAEDPGPTGNVISENTSTGNGIDLFHSPPSSPNTWTENTCGSSIGADIDCASGDGGGGGWNVLDGILAESTFLRADSNDNGSVDVSDSLFTLSSLFLGTDLPRCEDAADANDDGRVDLSDPLFTLASLFVNHEPIPSPFPQRGPDPTPDSLRCERATGPDRQDWTCGDVGIFSDYCAPSF